MPDLFPIVEIDGVELSEAQSEDYAELLDDCAGDESLCAEVWGMTYFNDGERWLDLVAVQNLETDENFVHDLEGNDLSFGDDK